MEPDIYTWLREHQTITSSSGVTYDVRRFKEAADEIERLRAEVEKLSSPLCPTGMSAIEKVEFLHDQILRIVKGYND